ncbi:hypothetical protein CLSAB_19070 [Clostridium saccharobutylicum]|uniref:hypothetical protein n=1 Tax=Clostridium saccharobutylicum TaxID=169679 RepID=UPI00098C2016|nr:hypothetical protein [Clostridium saccharobutylicum]OOM17187.1 hypothetical protein CLSAB_19070 [Clostridium saccharobutylicum]
MNIKNLFIKLHIRDFKVGDKVKPNPKIFNSKYKFITGEEYAVVRKTSEKFIWIYGLNSPIGKHEAILY